MPEVVIGDPLTFKAPLALNPTDVTVPFENNRASPFISIIQVRPAVSMITSLRLEVFPVTVGIYPTGVLFTVRYSQFRNCNPQREF